VPRPAGSAVPGAITSSFGLASSMAMLVRPLPRRLRHSLPDLDFKIENTGTAFAVVFLLVVPELTHSADIQLNERV
jgi:hypothetical protein